MLDSRRSLILLVALAAVVAGCAAKEEPAPEPAPAEEAVMIEEPAPLTAVAVLEPRAGEAITGSVSFTETAAGVAIAAHIEGVAPGVHGLHLHEVGDCSAEDFTSAGGHFNPTDAPHGAPSDAERHAGDFGNITVGEGGVGHLELTSDLLSVEGGPMTVVGRSVILHEGEDDLVSQPTGAAGGRLACGVVELAGEEGYDDYYEDDYAEDDAS